MQSITNPEAGIRAALINELASVEGVDPQEIEDMLASKGGDNFYELDSKTAESVIAGLEVAYGVKLPAPADLDPRDFATIGALANLLAAHVPTQPQGV